MIKLLETLSGFKNISLIITETSIINLNSVLDATIKLLSNEKLTKIITCTDLCPICGKCLDESCSLNEHNDKCHVDGDSYIFEAEEATFISGNKGLPKAGEHNNKYPNDQYV